MGRSGVRLSLVTTAMVTYQSSKPDIHPPTPLDQFATSQPSRRRFILRDCTSRRFCCFRPLLAFDTAQLPRLRHPPSTKSILQTFPLFLYIKRSSLEDGRFENFRSSAPYCPNSCTLAVLGSDLCGIPWLWISSARPRKCSSEGVSIGAERVRWGSDRPHASGSEGSCVMVS